MLCVIVYKNIFKILEYNYFFFKFILFMFLLEYYKYYSFIINWCYLYVCLFFCLSDFVGFDWFIVRVILVFLFFFYNGF